MKRIIATLIVLFPIFAIAQVEFVEVTLVDAETGKHISGARVSGDQFSRISSQQGLVRVPIRIDTVRITHPAYETRQFQLVGLDSSAITLELAPRVFSDTVTISSASRREQSVADATIPVEAISRQEVELQNPQTAADLVGDASGVYVQKSQMGGGSPMIRGFSTSRVLIVVDGIRMNNAIFRSGNVHNIISIDPNTIDSAEVVYGPGSVIYGSDAIGGVMNFSTISPEFSQDGLQVSGSFFTRLNSANREFNGNAILQLSDRNWSVLLSASQSEFGDLRMGSNGFPEYQRQWYVLATPGGDRIVENPDPNLQRFTGYDQQNFTGKFSLAITPGLTASAGVYHSETGDIPRYDRLIETRGTEPRNAEWYYGPQRWQVSWLRLDYAAENPLFDAARLTLSSQVFAESRHDRRFGSDLLRNRNEEVDVFGANLDFDRYLGERIDLYYGFEYLDNSVQSIAWRENILTGEQQEISTRYPDGSTWESIAAYTSLVFRASDRLTFNLGARATEVNIGGQLDRRFFPFPFDSIDLETGDFSSSAGLSFAVNSRLMLFANLGSGFRAPNIDDVAKVFDSEPGAVVVPNPDLEPERVITGDVGILYTFASQGRARFNAFYTRLEDAMVRRDSSFGGREFIVYDGELSRVQAIVNADEATVWGVETSLELPLNEWLSTTASLAITEGETESGESLRHVAPTFGTISARVLTAGLITKVSLVWNGEISADELAPSERGKPHLYALNDAGEPFSPSWWRVDIKSLYPIADGFTLSFGVENIFDERYRPYSSGLAGPGRGLYLGVRRSF